MFYSNDYVTCRITGSGVYMGIRGPRENLVISRNTYMMLKRVGAPIEIYDPKKQTPKPEVKKEEPKQVAEPVKETEIKIEEEPKIVKEETQEEVVDVESTETEEYVDVVDYEPTFELDDDIDDEIEMILAQPVSDEEAFSPYEEVVSEKPVVEEGPMTEGDKTYPHTVYTDSMLDSLTKEEMKEILTRRGHTEMRDPFRGKQVDTRADLYAKIKNTQ